MFLKQKDMIANVILINHERIDLRQQLEFLVLPFYLIYFIEFCVNLIKCKNVNRAYYNISFEKKAYQNEKDLEFLKSRPAWNFRKYYKS